MLWDEPPKTITFIEPRRSIRATSLGGSQKSWQQQSQSKQYDYMEPPRTSRGKPLQPIFPWEEHVKEQKNPSPTSTSHNHRKRSLPQSQHAYVLVILLFVTVALTTGKLLEGVDASAAEDNQTTANGGKQRGQPLPSASTGEEMYRVYRAMQDEYHHATTIQTHKWKLLNERGGAKVSLLQHDSDPSCPYVRMEATIPTSVVACWEFLGIVNWHWSMPKMDPFYDNHEVHSNYTYKGVNMVLVQKKTHRILAFGKRDFTFLSVTDLPRADGTMVSGSVSVETPDVPRSKGYTRAFQDSIAFYEPIMVGEEEHCRLTIVCRIDLNDSTPDGNGGFMPMWLYVKTIGATGIKSMLKMKKALMEMKKEQQQQQMVVVEAEEDEEATVPAPLVVPVASPTGPPLYENTQSTTTSPVVAETTKDSKWGILPRGGASFVANPIPEYLPTTAPAMPQRWEPLYGVYTHIAPVEPRPKRRPKWLQHVPLVGNFKQGKLL